MSPEKEKVSSTKRIKEAAAVLNKAIDESGWVSNADLIKLAEEQGIDIELVHQAVRLLDRRKRITGKRNPEGVQGWESLLGPNVNAKRYGGLSAPVRLRMVFITAPLGQISKDQATFRFLRDDQGQIQFTPAQCRAMLVKAYRLSGIAADETMSEAAIARVQVTFNGVKEAGIIDGVVRRPINKQKMAVGELLHEGLAPGSWAEWTFAFPVTHFSPDTVDRLLATAQSVGFSPAGSGRAGGNHGLFRWEAVNEPHD